MGMGSKRERRAGHWELRLYAGTVDGKKRYRSSMFQGSARQADAELRRLMAALDIQRPTDPTTVEGLIEHAFKVHSEWSPATISSRRYYSDKHIKGSKFGAMRAGTVTVTDINEFWGQLELGPSAIRKLLILLSVAYREAIKEGRLVMNPVALARKPKQIQPQLEYLTDATLDRLCLHATDEFACAMRILAHTGVRRGELAALTWADVDLEAGLLHVRQRLVATKGGVERRAYTKTGDKRQVPLSDDTAELFAQQRARCEERAASLEVELAPSYPVFPNQRTLQAWRPDSITTKFDRVCKVAGVKARLHDLRHKCATDLRNAGVPDSVVMYLMGHHQSSTLDRYTRSVSESERDAVGVMFLRRQLQSQSVAIPAPTGVLIPFPGAEEATRLRRVASLESDFAEIRSVLVLALAAAGVSLPAHRVEPSPGA